MLKGEPGPIIFPMRDVPEPPTSAHPEWVIYLKENLNDHQAAL